MKGELGPDEEFQVLGTSDGGVLMIFPLHGQNKILKFKAGVAYELGTELIKEAAWVRKHCQDEDGTPKVADDAPVQSDKKLPPFDRPKTWYCPHCERDVVSIDGGKTWIHPWTTLAICWDGFLPQYRPKLRGES